MVQLQKIVGHAPGALAGIALLAAFGLSACRAQPDNAQTASPPRQSAVPSLARSRDQLAASIADIAEKGQPISDQAQLAARLRLDPARIRAFNTPAATVRRMSVGFRSNFICAGDVCICFGDDDCNNLFSVECRNPLSGGVCWVSGASVVCACSPAHVS